MDVSSGISASDSDSLQGWYIPLSMIENKPFHCILEVGLFLTQLLDVQMHC